MESDKLIEAMAQAMAQTEYPAMSYEELATAALNALRDTLEPVGYHHTREGYDQYLTFYRVTPEEGWTETPLFALPEVKP